jgi:hypothetical protein
MSNIHTLERHTFPVLSEQFLVDKTYDFIKELGQGQYMSYLPAHRVGGSLEGGTEDARGWSAEWTCARS